MALQYGMNLMASDIRSQLEKNDRQQNGIRSFRQLFGNASLGNANMTDSNKSYYSDAMAQAYKANFNQSTGIINSGISTGGTGALLGDNKSDLSMAYQNYVKNYANDTNTINTDYNNEITSIGGALTERADNYAKLYNSTYDYLSNMLYGSSFNVDDSTTVDYLDEHDMNWLKDDTGKLKDWSAIMTELSDGTGKLNAKGTKFFDQIFNSAPQGYTRLDDSGNVQDALGFSQWLSNTDNELYNWYTGEDIFNYNLARTNRGTANQMIGKDSTDDTYRNSEYIDKNAMKEFEKSTIGRDSHSFGSLTISKQLAKEHQKANSAYSSMGSVFATKNYDADEKKYWNEYKLEAGNAVTKLDATFKTAVGSELYNEFTTQNKALYDKYYADIKKLNKIGYYTNKDASFLDDMNKAYQDIIAKMNSFISTKAISNKSTGL